MWTEEEEEWFTWTEKCLVDTNVRIEFCIQNESHTHLFIQRQAYVEQACHKCMEYLLYASVSRSASH